MMSFRQQLRVLLPLGLAITFSLPGDLTLYAVLPTHTAAVGISVGMVGILLGANRLIRIPGNPLAGALYDRRGRRRLFLLGLLLGVISTAVYSLTDGFWPFLGGRLLWGMAWSLINVGGLMMVLDISTDADRGRLISVYQFWFLLGLLLNPMLGGFLTDALGFRPALSVCTAISAAGLLMALFTLPETKGDGVQASVVTPRAPPSNRRFLTAAYLYAVTFFAGNGVLMSTVSLYLAQRFGDKLSLGGITLGIASLAGIMLALRSLFALLAGPMAGYLSDRQGDRWPVVLVGLVMGAAGFAILGLGFGVGGIIIGVVLIALSSGILITALTALVGDSSDENHQGRAMGGLTAIGDTGSAAGPLLAYALASVIDLQWVYLMCAVAFLSGFVVLREDLYRFLSLPRLRSLGGARVGAVRSKQLGRRRSSRQKD